MYMCYARYVCSQTYVVTLRSVSPNVMSMHTYTSNMYGNSIGYALQFY